jgi:hypothetical protein
MFFLRSPVILVTDIYSHALYGEQWEQIRALEASCRILRPVRVFRIMEETDSQSIADAIINARFTPHSVFFPYRYMEAAVSYSSKLETSGNKKIKTFLFLNKHQKGANTESLISIESDAGVDSYRIGYSAAVLSREARVSRHEDSGDGGEIVFIYDTEINENEKSAFERGVQDGKFSGRTLFALNAEARIRDNIDCVVIGGPAAVVLQSVTETPVILLSWFYNTNYLPLNVKMQIDDSPYALIPKTFKTPGRALKAGSVITLPSNFKIINNRIVNRKLISELRKAIRAAAR